MNIHQPQKNHVKWWDSQQFPNIYRIPTDDLPIFFQLTLRPMILSPRHRVQVLQPISFGRSFRPQVVHRGWSCRASHHPIRIPFLNAFAGRKQKIIQINQAQASQLEAGYRSEVHIRDGWFSYCEVTRIESKSVQPCAAIEPSRVFVELTYWIVFCFNWGRHLLQLEWCLT